MKMNVKDACIYDDHCRVFIVKKLLSLECLTAEAFLAFRARCCRSLREGYFLLVVKHFGSLIPQFYQD